MLVKIYTILIIFYPILGIYSSGISTLSIADVLLLAIFVLGIVQLNRNKRFNINREWLSYLLFVIFHTLIISFFIVDFRSSFMTFLRYAVYMVSIVFFVPNLFDRSTGIATLRVSSYIVSIFAIIQAIGIYIFHRYIPGVIPFLKISREELLSYGSNYSSGILRIRSLFAEPAHLAAYLTICLAVCLFVDAHKRNWVEAAVISIALLLSVSSTAYFMLLFVWVGYIVFYFIRNKNRLTKRRIISMAFFLLIIGCVIIFVLHSSLFEALIKRNPRAMGLRTDGYSIFADTALQNPLHRLFGNGFVDCKAHHYLPSYPLQFWRFGWIGLVIWFVLNARILMKQNKPYQRMVELCFIVMCVGTMMAASNFIMITMALVFGKDILYNYETEGSSS